VPTTALGSAGRRGLAVAVVIGLALAACGDDGGDAAATSTTEVTTTTEATTTTSAAPACEPVTVPAGAEELTTAEGDADGDGQADELRSYRVGEEWHLQVALAADGGADLVVPTFGGAAGVIGGADVDGDGVDEVWARTGSGASATIVGLAELVDCALVRVTFATGAPAELPVGGSVGTTSGLACTDGGVTAYTATLTEGTSYDVVATAYGLDAGQLVERGTSTSTVDALDDAAFVPVTSFSCGDLLL
jgi:hypothetical protein